MKKTVVYVLFIIGTILCVQNGYAQNVYYVATGGDDTNPGTFDNPWGTWQKAFETAEPGDTVYFREGIWYPESQYPNVGTVIYYSPNDTRPRGHDGTTENWIHYFNYPGETPVLDLSKLNPTSDWSSGIQMLRANYIHLRGLTIRNISQHTHQVPAGIGATLCSNIKYENMTVHDVQGRGFYHMAAFGIPREEGGPIETPADTTWWINCDAYNLVDPLSPTPGNAADGWKIQNYPGGVFVLEGCRAWNVSDDGFDPSGSVFVYINNCWAFYNGHNIEGTTFDGNGFKTGAVADSITEPTRIITNSIAAFNLNHGFYDLAAQVYYATNSRYYNNISYKNGIGIFATMNSEKPWYLTHWRNNISYESTKLDPIGRPYNVAIFAEYPESNNTWRYAHMGSAPSFEERLTVTDADFVNLDSTTIMQQLMAPRKADGSLPDITGFRLSEGSVLKGGGTNVGMSENPDIGIDWAWLDAGGGVATAPVSESILSRSSPAFTFSTTRGGIVIEPVASQRGRIEVALYDGRGRQVSLLHNTLGESLRIETKAFAPGVYTIQVRTDGKSHTRRLVVSRQGHVGL